MPHISKRFLEKDKFININNQFYKAFENLVRNGKTKLIFNCIMTSTEKIMLSKRLAIIILLDQGESIYAIENTLKVSSSTVARISHDYENGKYDELTKEIRKYKSFWFQIQKIIPPKVGKNRFSNYLKF